MTIEDILLARAQEDAQGQPNMAQAAVIGAGLVGAPLGLMAGTAANNTGNTINRLKDRLAEGQGLTRQGVRGRGMRPGYRMAGGLVGAILGGALGVGTRQIMMTESPSARLLAKLQTDGSLSPSDTQALQNILADSYNNTLGM